MKKSVLVLFGGVSPEHDVSCSSAASLIGAISSEKYDVYCIGITKNGEWLLTEAPEEAIADTTSWLSHPGNKKVVISPDRSDRGLIVFDGASFETISIDIAFPMIHGENGEDGRLQGLLEIAGIPYVGSDVCSSACSMDKCVTMQFADYCGVPHPDYFGCNYEDYLEDPFGVASRVVSYFQKKHESVFPLFVKPASGGSSVGISKVHSEQELVDALAIAASYKGNIIVEEAIVGSEVKVAILDNGSVRFGSLCEINVGAGIFNDYKMKYAGTGSHKVIPAELPDIVGRELKDNAVRIYRALGCSGFARVDFFVQEDNSVIFNEINTVPGFTRKSIYPLMLEDAGISYEELVDELIASAVI